MVDRDTVEALARDIRNLAAEQKDDTEKVAAFFKEYHPILAGLAKAFARQWRMEAVDLYGDALVAAMECLGQLRQGREFPNFGGHVYLTVRNRMRLAAYHRGLVRTKTRDHKFADVLPTDGDMGVLLDLLPAPECGASARQRLWFKLEFSGYLTPRELQVCKMLFADYTITEIAKVLGLSRPTAYTILEDLRHVVPLILQ
jgi:DNA-directed RNA polymerase specialized sigma24 family protein